MEGTEKGFKPDPGGSRCSKRRGSRHTSRQVLLPGASHTCGVPRAQGAAEQGTLALTTACTRSWQAP